MPTSSREILLGRYHYDPLDRLVDSTRSEQAATQRYYCDKRLATEIEGSVQRSIVQHDDHLLALQRREGTDVSSTLLATDQQRSVLNALDENQPNPLAYSPYGHRSKENGLLTLLGFNGEPRDPVTGCYHLGNGYRQFNPVLMRFNSPDSWSPFGGGGVNAYAYCGGDPINRVDPNGHMVSLRAVWGKLMPTRPTQRAFDIPAQIPHPKFESDKVFRSHSNSRYNLTEGKITLVENYDPTPYFYLGKTNELGNYFLQTAKRYPGPIELIGFVPHENIRDPLLRQFARNIETALITKKSLNANDVSLLHPLSQMRDELEVTFRTRHYDAAAPSAPYDPYAPSAPSAPPLSEINRLVRE